MRDLDIVLKEFKKNGIIRIKQAIYGQQLENLQSTFDSLVQEDKSMWLKKVRNAEASALFLDIENPLQRSDQFKRLIKHPSYADILDHVSNNRLLHVDTFVRITPSNPVSYVPWHTDFSRPHPFAIKILIYVEDVSDNQGSFAYVSGSHVTGSNANCHKVEKYQTYPGLAGTALIFNPFGVHTAIPNRSGTPRKVVINSYQEQRV